MRGMRGIPVPLVCKELCFFEVIKQQHNQSDDIEPQRAEPAIYGSVGLV